MATDKPKEKPQYPTVAEPQLVDYEEVHTATDAFTVRLGSGGFGDVYKGSWRGQDVAVKRWRPDSRQGLVEFNKEVEISSKVPRGSQLLPVLAYCVQPESCLVYPLIPNGTVEERLLCLGGAPPLRYGLRLRIAGDVAQALQALHGQMSLVHADISATNVLLDAGMRAFLTDFGLSQPIGQGAKKGEKGTVKGTAARQQSMSNVWNKGGQAGYVDPEGDASNPASDVYGLGVLLLQLLTGKAAVDPFERPPELVERVRHKLAAPDTLFAAHLDPAAHWPPDAMRLTAGIAKLCLHPRSAERPSMEELEQQLAGAAQEAAACQQAAADTVACRWTEEWMQFKSKNTVNPTKLEANSGAAIMRGLMPAHQQFASIPGGGHGPRGRKQLGAMGGGRRPITPDASNSFTPRKSPRHSPERKHRPFYYSTSACWDTSDLALHASSPSASMDSDSVVLKTLKLRLTPKAAKSAGAAAVSDMVRGSAGSPTKGRGAACGRLDSGRQASCASSPAAAALPVTPTSLAPLPMLVPATDALTPPRALFPIPSTAAVAGAGPTPDGPRPVTSGHPLLDPSGADYFATTSPANPSRNSLESTSTTLPKIQQWSVEPARSLEQHSSSLGAAGPPPRSRAPGAAAFQAPPPSKMSNKDVAKHIFDIISQPYGSRPPGGQVSALQPAGQEAGPSVIPRSKTPRAVHHLPTRQRDAGQVSSAPASTSQSGSSFGFPLLPTPKAETKRAAQLAPSEPPQEPASSTGAEIEVQASLENPLHAAVFSGMQAPPPAGGPGPSLQPLHPVPVALPGPKEPLPVTSTAKNPHRRYMQPRPLADEGQIPAQVGPLPTWSEPRPLEPSPSKTQEGSAGRGPAAVAGGQGAAATEDGGPVDGRSGSPSAGEGGAAAGSGLSKKRKKPRVVVKKVLTPFQEYQQSQQLLTNTNRYIMRERRAAPTLLVHGGQH